MDEKIFTGRDRDGILKEKGGSRMKKIKITAVRQTVYEDLMARYENPM